MAIIQRVRQYLVECKVPYRELSLSAPGGRRTGPEVARTPLSCVAVGQLLRDRSRLVLATYPATHVPDLGALSRILGRELAPVPPDVEACVLDAIEFGNMPPLGEAFGFDWIIDRTLTGCDRLCFTGGYYDSLIQVQGAGVTSLLSRGQMASFAVPAVDSALDRFTVEDAPAFETLNALHIQAGGQAQRPVTSVLKRMRGLASLPALPDAARRILQMRLDPRASAFELAQILDDDPGLRQQVLRYARASSSGYRGSIDSIEDAVTHVFGFEVVMNMAFAIAAAGGMTIAPNGPLGRRALLRHAVYSAALAQNLARRLPEQHRPDPGMSYLAGLMHNFGLLLLGHVFPQEFHSLNTVLALSPRLTLSGVERPILGAGHEQIGANLMIEWGMPEEIVVAALYHHNVGYRDVRAVYPNLVLISDRLLRRYGMGDAESTVLPGDLLQSLGISEAEASAALAEVMSDSHGLDELVGALAA